MQEDEERQDERYRKIRETRYKDEEIQSDERRDRKMKLLWLQGSSRREQITSKCYISLTFSHFRTGSI